ncbi:substrate-binding domain-containing protein [Methanohalophilus halophilus]|uniref:Phosphate ABC transporter substrate-binding protein, PhoT family n=1 Tax=Methanohalophilus halophilus TaxID=2177 RepID=A0A1L3Q4D7_9EURY|nr:substrate-binding domain-containing protein [Methanohalophilus halophilus]APH39747.1 hypothetical protein BHR79_09825 [Methanohalophilus halophilus]RNI08914.1 hypothetical protein EFE40_05435 [Methanohalophilus halophilus]SDW38605.1 phosphate ABC transporter substrate-binding protein, PhoT family [Methanohalophilus halophilus]
MELKNIFNNEEAVSPIVATLVLVVVAIAGAAAVGGIMDNLSNDVGSDTTGATDDIATANELLLRGSTSVQPVSELLADKYMRQHPNMKVTVMGTGSGDGVSSTGLDLCDIGAASRPVKDSELAVYPEIRSHQIGASAVAIISNVDVNGTGLNFTDVYAVEKLYNSTDEDGKAHIDISSDALNITAAEINEGDGTGANTINVTVYQRSEPSGTEETVSKYLSKYGSTESKDAEFINDESNAKGAKGNAGVLAAVEDDANGIGFVDWGFAQQGLNDEAVVVNGINCQPLATSTADISDADDEFKLALEGESDYPQAMTRPLNYLTLGNPTPEQQDFIDFALASSGETQECFTEAGFWSMYTLNE